jgi:hypothetical protein
MMTAYAAMTAGILLTPLAAGDTLRQRQAFAMLPRRFSRRLRSAFLALMPPRCFFAAMPPIRHFHFRQPPLQAIY